MPGLGRCLDPDSSMALQMRVEAYVSLAEYPKPDETLALQIPDYEVPNMHGGPCHS
jgi:hypothetical protein